MNDNAILIELKSPAKDSESAAEKPRPPRLRLIWAELFDSRWFSQCFTGERARVFPAVNGQLAIDNHVLHSCGKNFGTFVSRAVGDGLFVEHDHVGEIAEAEFAAVFQLESLGDLQRTGLDHSRQRDDVTVEDVFANLARVCAVFARVTAGAVRSGHHPGLLHEVFDVAFGHVERGHAGVARFDDVERGFDRAFAARFGDLVQAFTDQAAIGSAFDEQRIRAAATFQVLFHLGDQFGADRRIVNAFEHLLLAAGFGPARQQRRAEARTRSDVWILIGRDVDAFGAGAVDDLDGVSALAPDIGAKRLDVRDVNGNPRFAADANHLFNRT